MVTAPPSVIRWEELQDLFSVVMCMDESMSIIYASKTLKTGLPRVVSKPVLSEIFNVVRPSSLDTFSDGCSSVGSLCLLIAKSGSFAVRGQLIKITHDGQDVLCFCGAPWLFWIKSNSPETHLGLSDFAAQDVQLDQLFFMSAEAQMVNDLEKLTSDLQTAKRELEQAQQAQQQFFAHMSHEIRTPLNGVVSALSLLDGIALDEEPADLVRLARSSSRNLMQVVNYVLNISKLELSPLEDLVAINLNELIKTTVDVVSAKAEEKLLNVQLNLSSDIPANCYMNADRLRQTLLNLLVNAIKFTDKGGITVSARPLNWGGKTCRLRIEVADTGVGIPEKDLQHVFKPFWSSRPVSGNGVDEGTGLGLDIVQRNVKSMGGNIQLSSQQGKGTRVWFDISVTLADKAPSHYSGEKNATALLQGKVLLVDDNETNLILGSLILESLGVEVVSVDSGLKAVSAAKKYNFDLILMDISMPDIDGIEATRRIRKFADKEQLPIVALTAHIDITEERACLNSGMNGYLTKPIEKDALHEKLLTWLAKDLGVLPRVDSSGYEQKHKESKHEVLSKSILDNLAEQIGLDNLEVVTEKVKSESIIRWSELVAAKLAGDRDSTQRNVHSLASIFRSVGLMSVGESLGEIEIELRANRELVSSWLQDIEQLKIVSMNALEDRVAQMTGKKSTARVDSD